MPNLFMVPKAGSSGVPSRENPVPPKELVEDTAQVKARQELEARKLKNLRRVTTILTSPSGVEDESEAELKSKVTLLGGRR